MVNSNSFSFFKIDNTCIFIRYKWITFENESKLLDRPWCMAMGVFLLNFLKFQLHNDTAKQ